VSWCPCSVNWSPHSLSTGAHALSTWCPCSVNWSPHGCELGSHTLSAGFIPVPLTCLSLHRVTLVTVQWPSSLLTCSQEYHKGYLGGHLHEVRHLGNAPLPIFIPLGEIPQNNLDCQLPHENISTFSETWLCDLLMPSPLIALGSSNIWTM